MCRKCDDEIALEYLAIIDMERAQRSIEISRSTEDGYLKAALFRDAVICYAKPFLSSRYSDNKGGLRISIDHVPENLRGLHGEILDLRNRLIAHTDMTIQKPIVHGYSQDGDLSFSLSVMGYETIHKEHLFEPLTRLARNVFRSLMENRFQQAESDVNERDQTT